MTASHYRDLSLAAFAALALGAPFLVGCSSADDAPLVFVFQKQKEPEALRPEAERLAARIGTLIQRNVKTVIPQDYGATVQALVSKQADVAWLSAIPFLLARRDGGARLLLAEQRPDQNGALRTDYDSVFVVRADAGLKDVHDLVQRAKELKICFTSQTSTSGYVMPFSRLVDEGLLKAGQDPRTAFASVTFGGGYTAALEQVVNGRADVCAVSAYTVEGERADRYLDSESRKQLRILGRTPGVPTHLLCVRGGLDPDLVDRIRSALLQISTEEPALLAGVYGAASLVEVDELAHVHAAALAVKRAGIPLEDF